MDTARAPDDSIVRELIGRRFGGTKIRVVVQTRRPQKAKNGEVKDTSYSQVPGHARVVEVRTLREFRRLWRAIDKLIESEGWRDGRGVSAPSELPAAGPPLDTHRP